MVERGEGGCVGGSSGRGRRGKGGAEKGIKCGPRAQRAPGSVETTPSLLLPRLPDRQRARQPQRKSDEQTAGVVRWLVSTAAVSSSD